jgi:DNA-directed RNA polymerase subunit RPC12/RpoP
MSALAVQPDADAAAIQDMISEGAPDPLPPARRPGPATPVCVRCGATKSKSKSSAAARCATCGFRNRLDSSPEHEPSAAARAAERRAARRVFRLYCIACSRSSEVSTPPARSGRCSACGGTMLTELAP